MFLRIISVVEGHGETFALPLLLRRMASEVRPEHWIHAPHPFRVPRDKFLKKGQLERYFQAAAAQAANGGVLILMDSEDPVAGCPANLGPEIRRRALAVRVDVPLLVVIAKNEYESWFLAAAESLQGKRRLRMELTATADPEAIRGAKEWLDERMVDGSRYSETVDQPAMTELFDLQAARRSPSFDRFYRRFGAFCDEIASRASS